MQKKIFFLVIFLFLLVVTFLPLIQAIDITSCTTIDSAGDYFLTTSISNSVSLNCINITSPNVIFDCQGNTIDGKDTSGSYGIFGEYIYPVALGNITIKNCIMTDWIFSIWMEDTINSTIYNNTIKSSRSGITVIRSDNFTINNNVMNFTGEFLATDGIRLDTSDNCTIENNYIYSYTIEPSITGIMIYQSSIFGSNGNIIKNNTLLNLKYGIYMTAKSNDNLVFNNNISGSYTSGIILNSVPFNNIYNNFLNSTINVDFYGTVFENYWNTSKQLGQRIYSSGMYIGGNYWTNSSKDGYSDTCDDSDKNGFCDVGYNTSSGLSANGLGNNIDYMPLSDEYMGAVQYSNWQNNNSGNTYINDSVNFSIDYISGAGLSWYFFSHNQSGTMTNVSNNTINGNMKFLNYTLNITLNRDNYICGQFWANNTLGDINQTNLSCFTVANSITTIPVLHKPDDTESFEMDYVILNYSSSDADSDTIIYSIYNSTDNDYFSLLYNGTDNTYNWSSLSDGTYYWKVKAGDGIINSSNSSSRSFIIATVAPAITLNYPAIDEYLTDSLVEFNFTAADVNGVHTCKLHMNSSGTFVENQSLTSVTSGVEANFTKLDLLEGAYFWNVWCNDTLDNNGFSGFNRTNYVDLYYPNLTVTSPVQSTTYYTETVSLTISTADLFRDKCFYDLYYKDSGILKVSNNDIDCSGTTTLDTPYYSGGYMLNVSVNDSAGQVNSTIINFTTIAPPTPVQPPSGGGSATIKNITIINFTKEAMLDWGIPQLIFNILWTPIQMEKGIAVRNIGNKAIMDATISMDGYIGEDVDVVLCDLDGKNCLNDSINIGIGDTRLVVARGDFNKGYTDYKEGIIDIVWTDKEDKEEMHQSLTVTAERLPGYRIIVWMSRFTNSEKLSFWIFIIVFPLIVIEGFSFILTKQFFLLKALGVSA